MSAQSTGDMRPPRMSDKKHTITLSIFKKLLLVLVVILSVMAVAFFSTDQDISDQIVMSVDTSARTFQATAHDTYSATEATRDSIGSAPAYTDAADSVAAYDSGLVRSVGGLIMGDNSPTRAYDPQHAYVVNVLELLTEEIQDIITFEQNTLGIKGHSAAVEYAREKLPIAKSITAHYGSGRKNLWYGAVAPAVTIRDFYSAQKYTGHPTGAIEYFNCFGGADNAYIDAMLVKSEDVVAYFSGYDIPVSYVQFRMFAGNAKAHTAPWGINQTYFQMNKGGTMQPNTSSGGFTDEELGTTPITGNAPEDLGKLLDLARGYQERGESVYWWPTILATAEDLGVATSGRMTGVTSNTANIFESYNTAQYTALQDRYEGYSLVGILVYATQ